MAHHFLQSKLFNRRSLIATSTKQSQIFEIALTSLGDRNHMFDFQGINGLTLTTAALILLPNFSAQFGGYESGFGFGSGFGFKIKIGIRFRIRVGDKWFLTRDRLKTWIATSRLGLLRRRTPLAKLPILHSQKPEYLHGIYHLRQVLNFNQQLPLAFVDS